MYGLSQQRFRMFSAEGYTALDFVDNHGLSVQKGPEWERGREDYRKARAEGLSYQEYQDKLYEEQTARDLEEQAPSEDDVEEVAVIVYFPKLDAEHEGEQDALMIKARISTLAISGLTPRQAQAVAESRGQTSAAATGSTAEGGN